MRYARNVALAVVGLTLFATTASAQRGRGSAPRLWELGVDAALSFGLDDPSPMSLQIPVANFRAGVALNPEWSVEPSLAFTHYKDDNDPDPVRAYVFGVGALYHLSESRARSQMYVRPFIELIGVSAGGTSNTDTALGAGFGMKWPRLNGRMAWRGEANLARFFDSEQTALNLLFGISFFTR
jgi:hypothetical protein